MSLSPLSKTRPVAGLRLLLRALLIVIAVSCSASPALAQKTPPKPHPDVIVFNNGDRLTGSLERAAGNSLVFKSDIAGEITVSLDKVKELHSSGRFAVLRKDIPLTRKSADVPTGAVAYGDGKLTVQQPAPAAPEVVPAAQIGYIIDQPTYAREMSRQSSFLYGWNGAINGGATLVRSTDNGETLTAGIALVRAMPTVAFLPAASKTLFNVQETYGKLTSPVIPQTVPPSAAAVTETSILHIGAERDEYFSSRLFALAQTAFDHNYSQGLNLQQIYGAGVGWTAIKSPRQQFDLKVSLQYEKQTFQTASTNEELVGSTISEAYHRDLPRKIILTESANIIPAFNDPNAYSANANFGIALPVYKRLSVTFTTTDNFLNDPSLGYNKNSFQFVTAAAYTLK
jgi:hypothetical protein